MKNAVNTVAKFLTDPLAAIRSAAGQVRATEAEKRQEYEAALAERARLLDARAPLEDVIQNLETEIRDIAEQWITTHGMAIVDSAGGRMQADASGHVTGPYRPLPLTAALGAVDLGMLCAFFPNEMRDGLRRAVERTTYAAGEPLAERAARIAAADTRIAALAAEHAELVAAAAESDIQLPELEENRYRRLLQQREQESIARFNQVNARGIARGGLKPAGRLEETR